MALVGRRFGRAEPGISVERKGHRGEATGWDRWGEGGVPEVHAAQHEPLGSWGCPPGPASTGEPAPC